MNVRDAGLMSTASLWSLLLVMVVAAIAPLLTRSVPGHPPQVLFLILGGLIIGPHGLGTAETEDVRLLAELGLGFIFLLAGYELDLHLLRQRPGRQALVAWSISTALSLSVVGGLQAVGYVHAFVPVAIGLTTTALGTLLPILRERHTLTGSFGQTIFAAGAAGELLPIVAISLFLGAYRTWREALIIAAIAILALGLAWLARMLSNTRVARVVTENSQATSQLTLRVTIVLLVGLLLVTAVFGVEAALGAFFAGMVLRLSTARSDRQAFDDKLDAVGYGIFIPVFFISSGMTLDIESIVKNPLRLLVFFVLLLVVRGLPAVLVYRRSLVARERVEMVFLTATTLPLLVALAQIGLQSGVMRPENAAALVGAGVLSVAVFPALAIFLHARAPTGPSAVATPLPNVE